MSYTTIKIPVEIHKKIKFLSSQAKIAQQELLIQCLLDYENKLFWIEFNNAYSVAKTNEETSINDDELLYENTLMDGLDDEY